MSVSSVVYWSSDMHAFQGSAAQESAQNMVFTSTIAIAPSRNLMLFGLK